MILPKKYIYINFVLNIKQTSLINGRNFIRTSNILQKYEG